MGTRKQPGDRAMDLDQNSDGTGAAPRGRGTLWALSAGQRGRYAAAIVAMGFGTVFLLLVPYVLQNALDALNQHGEQGGAGPLAGTADNLTRTLVLSALAIVGLNALHGLFTYVRGKWASEASESIVRGLRHE